jgi:hypothetical protein
MPSDFHYVISGLTGEPKCARFFAFLVLKSELMIRFENIKRLLTPDIIAQKILKSCDVISGFYFEPKSSIFCRFQLLTSKLA